MLAARPEIRGAALAWLALATFLVYANALNGSFQFDDYNVIVYQAQVHDWHAWLASLGNGIRPLLKFSYTLNWTMGVGVTGFHLTNLLIHFINTCLVYRLAQEFVRQQWQQAQLMQVPLLAALLFAVHPIHTEAISYISGRSVALMNVFYLAGMLSYIKGRMLNDKRLLYLATPLLFLLALLSKETAATFPLALLAWEWCCGGRWQTALKPLWASAAVWCIAVVFFLFNDSYFGEMQRSAGFNSLQGNLATQLAAFVYLMRQLALPLWLNIDPDLPVLTNLPAAFWPLTILIAMFAVMLLCWRKRPWLSFALTWAVLHLIPLYVLLPRLDIANERQLYLVSWPLLLALAIELTLWLNLKNMKLVALALLLCLATLTVLRNRVYASEVALWEDTALRSPHKARIYNNLGYAYMTAHREEDARRAFATALQLDPQLVKARFNLERLNKEAQPQ